MIENFFSINILLLIAILCGYVAFVSARLKIEIGIAAPFFMVVLLSLLFIAAMVFALKAAVVAIYMVGIALFFYQLLFSRRSLSQKGVILIGALLLIYYLRVAHGYYSYFDDLGLWASAARDVFFHDNLPQKGEVSLISSHLYYVRGASLFQYFNTKLLGLTEGHNIFAIGAITILFASVGISKKSFWLSLFCIVAIVAPSMLLTHNLRSLYLDPAVGFGFGVLIWIIISEESRKAMLLSIPFLFALPQIKEVGFWFSYIALFVLLLRIAVLDRKNLAIKLILLALLALIPLLSEFLWKHYLESVDLIQHMKPKLGFTEFFSKLFLSEAGSDDHRIISQFFKGFFRFLYLEGMIAIYALIAFSVFITCSYNKEKVKEMALIYLSITLCFIAYILFRLSLYFTHFTLGEAITNASGWRYLATFVIVYPFIAVYYIKDALEKITIDQYPKLKNTYYVLFTALVLILIGNMKRPELSLPAERKQAHDLGEEAKIMLDEGKDPSYLFKELKSGWGCLSLRQEALGKGDDRVWQKCVSIPH
jgi:hypothetical protein